MGLEIHHGVRIEAWGLKCIKVGHGVGMHHGVRNTPWGEKCVKGRALKKGCVCVTILVGRRNSGGP